MRSRHVTFFGQQFFDGSSHAIFSQTAGGAKLVFASVSLFHGTAWYPAQMRGAFGFFILR
jgi:hypothetical protein